MNWGINLFFTLPHNRCILGWAYASPDEEASYHTFELYLTILSIQVNWD